jgi:flagellar hook-associated protein 1 FlgK
MNLGTRSMQNSQVSLQTAGHNISNANTEGYSKQRAETVSEHPFTYGEHIIGDGAKIRSIRRSHDEFLTRQINKENESYGSYSEKSQLLDSVESIFNESNEEGLSSRLTKFYNEMRKLSNNPENLSLRTSAFESARSLVNDLHRVGTSLDKVQRNVDSRLITSVEELNSMLKELAVLNRNISKLEVGNKNANDLRDRRDVLLKNMSKIVDINYVEDPRTGMVSITMAGTATVLNGTENNELSIHRTSTPSGEGLLRLVMKADSGDFDITDSIRRGTLKGMLDVRDETVPVIREKLEHMFYQFANRVNAVHARGFDMDGKSGRKFFDNIDSAKGVLMSIQLSKDLEDSPRSIAAASRPFEPANNEIVQAITELQRERYIKHESLIQTFPEKDLSLGVTGSDFYNAIIGDLAISARETRNIMEHQQGVVDQLSKFRESSCGVSLDEEGIDLIKYQKAFEAAARMIRVADELLETVMALKRM